MRRTLIVTNDFPPRQGGIQSFVHELARRLDPERLTVYAPKWEGDAAFDAAAPFEVVRHPTSLMIGGPSVRRRAAELARSRQAEVVIFGASAPLGLITPVLRKAGVRRAIAITHGHEAGWAALPVARGLLRRIGEETDVVTYLGEYFRVRLAGALTPEAAARMTRLHPGVDAADLPPRPAGQGGDQGTLRPRRPPRGGLRLPPGPAQGPGHAAARLARGARRGAGRGPADCQRRPVRRDAAPARGAGRRGELPSGSPARSRRTNCPRTTPRATSSPCPAAPGAAASTWRASASSTWRRPRRACPSSAATPAAHPTRSLTARPATWSAAVTPARCPRG